MIGDSYILVNGELVRTDIMIWASWFETADREILETFIRTGFGYEIRVFTVFIGLDHRATAGPPLLWETHAEIVQNGFNTL